MMRITRSILAFCLCTCSVYAVTNVDDIEGLLAEKEYTDAIQALDKLISQEPMQPQYLFLRARALAASGQSDAAITQYKKLIQSHPELPEAYNNLASIYAKQGELSLAEQLLNQAMQTNEAFATVYNNLSTLNAVKARKAYAKALKIPVGTDNLKIKPLTKLALAQVEAPLQQENQGLKVLKPDANPTLVYKAGADNADKNSKPAMPKADDTPDKQEVVSFIEAWARAWSSQDVAAYIRYYHKDYAPRGMSRKTWLAHREQRIKRPKWIKVQLSNFELQSRPHGELRIRMEQLYKTDSYSDLTRKEFILKQDNGQWVIIKERGLGFIKK